MKTAAIIQARMSSTRLPGKIMLPLKDKPVLQNITERIMAAKNIDDIIVATSTEISDDIVENFCVKTGIKVFRGSLNNVLERFYKCASMESADVIVRLTADNALIDGNIIDDAVEVFFSGGLDYLSYKEGLPLGMHVEVFSFDALGKSYQEAKDPECLEHVTPYMIKNPAKFRVLFFADEEDADNSSMRFTMDTPEDYEFVKRVYDSFTSNIFSYGEILKLLSSHKELLAINQNIRQKALNYNGEQ